MNLYWIYALIKIAKRGCFFHRTHGWHGACKLTWRVGPTRGCDLALRPRVRAARGPREAQVARTCDRRPSGSTRTPLRGATWQSGGWRVKGPRVSGPWLGDWGGKANALPRPIFYTYLLPIFPPCGTKVPAEFNLCRTRGNTADVGYTGINRNASIRWTRSPRDH